MVVTARVTRRRAETRARMLDAAFRVAVERGLGQLRIDDVCTAAGYTRGAFYSQFTSVEDLLTALYDEYAEAAARRIVEEISAGPVTELRGQVDRIADLLPWDRERLVLQAEFRLRAARDPGLAARVRGQRERLLAAVEGELQPWADGLGLPAALPTVADVAQAVATIYDGVLAGVMAGGDPDGARAWLVRMVTALLPGPGGPAGGSATEPH